VVVATKNPDKRAEVVTVLSAMAPGLEIVDDAWWPDVEETGSTLEQNALLKARAAAEATGLPVIADDTGLEVDALGGAPGVHTARFAGPAATYRDNRTALLAALDGVDERSAQFRTVAAFVDGSIEITAAGTLQGSIARSERGSGGFGYDPVFEVDGRTLAEVDVDEKNRMSHRAMAIAALVERLPLR
jgi:XTP/dITP diphosphohydrolase